MGQKINPVSLRLHYTNRHFDNSWYSDYFYKNLITRDIILQQYLNNFLKLLKLPAGRYSIQHLQKKTQVYNFLCYPKSTREWRSKLFGLTKKNSFLKKSRFFFKYKTEFKRKTGSPFLFNKGLSLLKDKGKQKMKLSSFYTTLKQLSIHKIQKKITSFQNLKLWSLFFKKKSNKSQKDLPYTFNLLKQLLRIDQLGTTSSPISSFSLFLPFLFFFKLKKDNKQKEYFFLIKKDKNQKEKIESSQKQNICHNACESMYHKQYDNSSLVFLQNLFVYKKLKSNLSSVSFNSFAFFSEKRLKRTTFSPLTDKKMNSLQAKTNEKARQPFVNSLDYKYKNYLESNLSSLYKLDLDLTAFKVKNDWQYASYLADEIVYFLEKRIPFRRLKSKILRQLSKISQIRGVRITCSGRVGGKSKKAQRAKTECLKYGQTSLQVFSSKIDFSVKTAFTSFGSVGVKVWICYN